MLVRGDDIIMRLAAPVSICPSCEIPDARHGCIAHPQFLKANDVLKEQRKYRYPVNKMDFTFNRICDLNPIGNRVDGALLVSVITPLNDDYESYENSKCILESSREGGHIIIKLGNDESLGRDLRTCIQTEKYVRHKNDGSLPESAKRILRSFSEDNQERRNSLVTLITDMLAEADYYAAGQKLKLKATAAMAALNVELPCLVMCPSRRRFPLESSKGTSPR
ncbi:MAG: hypothetical protein WB558_11725 [Terriglobales bacterium]